MDSVFWNTEYGIRTLDADCVFRGSEYRTWDMKWSEYVFLARIRHTEYVIRIQECGFRILELRLPECLIQSPDSLSAIRNMGNRIRFPHIVFHISGSRIRNMDSGFQNTDNRFQVLYSVFELLNTEYGRRNAEYRGQIAKAGTPNVVTKALPRRGAEVLAPGSFKVQVSWDVLSSSWGILGAYWEASSEFRGGHPSTRKCKG